MSQSIERIQAELRGEVYRKPSDRPKGRREPDAEWGTLGDASRILCLSPSTVEHNAAVVAFVRRRSRSLDSASGRGVGMLWNREDCRTVRRIMTECRMTLSQASRVALALREGRV